MNSSRPAIDISCPQLAIVRAILQQHVPDHTVWAFGSRVTGKARPYSDLDLVIFPQPPLSLATYAALKEAFTQSDLPWKVDILDWAELSEEFRQIVKKNSISIQ